MFSQFGMFLDKIYYKAFPKKDDLHGIQLPQIVIPPDLREQDEQRFLEHAKPMLESLETIRQIKFRAYALRKKIAIPASAVLFSATGFLDYLLFWIPHESEGGGGFTLFAAGALYWWVTQPKREYAIAYKKKILPHLARLFGDFQYRVDGKIAMQIMKPSGLIPSHDRYVSEDFFEGRYKNIDIRFSEIKLTKREGSGKNRSTVTKFKGLAVLLALENKKFLGHTVLERNAGKFTQWLKEKGSALKRANMVDPEFEKIFDAYTNDQVEARYLIDPLMIENLKALYEEYDGQSLSAAWYDSQMLILIASKHNHFEPADIKTPATNTQAVLGMKREIGQILSIIDTLDLYDPQALALEKSQTAP